MPSHDLKPLASAGRILSAPEFQQLAEVPTEAQWFANIDNPQTRRAYQNDLAGFIRFAGITHPTEFRQVTRSHILAWRTDLEKQSLSGSTIRRKLAALASLFEYLCNQNAVLHNPVKGVKRPRVESQIGKTPALTNAQARQLLDAPPADTLKGMRDRAILSVLLYHGLRREELTNLKVKDFAQADRGGPRMRVWGKGGKVRYLPIHRTTLKLVAKYLAVAGHGKSSCHWLFQSLSHHNAQQENGGLTPGAIYSEIVKKYMDPLGIKGDNLGPHALRATAATCALENQADIAKVQEWLGHANINTTRVYDRRETRAQDSPTFSIVY
nr:tyrosine-type recombinase/integrase [Rhodoferax sp.]